MEVKERRKWQFLFSIDTAEHSDLSAGRRGTNAQTHLHILIGTLAAAHFVCLQDVVLGLVFAPLFQPISEPEDLLLQREVFWSSQNSQS